MKVEIRLAKNTHSEPMNDQTPILRGSIPPDDGACSGSCDSSPKSEYSKLIPITERISTAAPIRTMRYQSMMRPRPIVPTPRLSTSGKIEGAGIWMCSAGGSDCGFAGGLTGALPDMYAATPREPARPYFNIHHASRPRICGIVAKLWAGGGDGVDHSRLRPSQGSAGARSPVAMLLKMLM